MNDNKIVVFGNSFSGAFHSIRSLGVDVFTVPGSMIKGLVNHNENYQKIAKINKTKSYDYAIFMFGDSDSYYYYFRKKYIDNVPEDVIYKKMKETSIQYVKLLKEFTNFKKIIVTSVSPPTITDDKLFIDALEIHGFRNNKTVIPFDKSEAEYDNRKRLGQIINKPIEEECKKYDIMYIDMYKLLLNGKKYPNELFLTGIPSQMHYKYESILLLLLNTHLKFIIEKNILKKQYSEISQQIVNSYNEYRDTLLKNNIKINGIDAKAIEEYAKKVYQYSNAKGGYALKYVNKQRSKSRDKSVRKSRDKSVRKSRDKSVRKSRDKSVRKKSY